MTAYLPVGSRNTWAFNHLRSDAIVSRRARDRSGQDPGSAGDQLQRSGAHAAATAILYRCGEPDDREQYLRHGDVARRLRRLRSYSQGRFRGAHTRFYGTEFRWNLTDEAKPFDLFVMKDIRTSLQLAAFYEMAALPICGTTWARYGGNPTASGSGWSRFGSRVPRGCREWL